MHKNRRRYRLITLICLLASLLTTVVLPGTAEAQVSFDDLAARAVQNNYVLFQTGTPVDDGWTSFGAYDAYVLDKAGVDLSSWVYESQSFKDKVLAKTYQILSNPSGTYSSKLLAQHLLAVQAFGDNEKANQLLQILNDRQKSTGNGSFDDNAFGDIAAFELLGRAGVIDQVYDKNAAIEYILSQRDMNTGAWTSSWNDTVATCQAIRALDYLKDYALGDQTDAVTQAIEAGLEWLKALQKENGSFQDDAGWDDPAIDTAEVIYTLTLLNMDPRSWKNSEENSPVTYLLTGALNGDGTFGTSKNIMDNTWVLDAYLMLDATVTPALLVNPPQATVSVGSTQAFTAQLFQVDGTETDVTSQAVWEVSDDSVASIDTGGVLSALAPGTTLVRASYGSLTGTATVTVAAANSGSGTTPGSGTISVNIAVVGKDGYLLYGPGSVELSPDDRFRLTAMGALDKTGLSWEFSSQWPGLVVAIEGERNEGMNGWCYSVNGSMPSVLPGDCSVRQNDKIIFWYSTNAMSGGPKWEDLVSGKYLQEVQTAAISPEIVQAVKETVSRYQSELEQVLTGTKILNREQVMSKSEVEALKKELAENQVSVTVKVGTEEAVLADTKQEVSLLIPAKALNETVEISLKELNSSQVDVQVPGKIASSLYEFEPSGTKFASPVTVTIKLPVDEDMKLELLTPAWYDEKNKQWVPIPGLIDAKKGLAVFKTDHFTKFAVIELPPTNQVVATKQPEKTISFPDVGENFAWAKEAIEYLAAKGVVRGTGKGFEPDRPVTRAEFAAMVANALGLTPDKVRGTGFRDVKYEDWFAGVIGAVANQGIASGYPDGTFGPGRTITRFEMASILARMPAVPAPGQLSQTVLRDKESTPAWARKSVEYVVERGLMRGCEGSTFQGQRSTTRAEAAVVVYRYLKSQAAEPGSK
ncbi:MAG: S-layer homology domain-containing protein [Syntrophothermus sp.]|uniref:S-layer homology domain-containing protein n=1 Tax=Syntrophothermus sp. TaxID=2736299 RepID=UPI002580F53F|nr:S-layer homology domain-containing protein [Syntrophothermus sp.]NSW81781.1 S-layer homology domain-containing protein [Syntrophothermus sp.]